MFDLSGFFAEWLEAVPSTGILVATFVVVCVDNRRRPGESIIFTEPLFAQIVAQALIATAIYNLFFHKLAKFPGPFLARSSLVSIPLPLPSDDSSLHESHN